MVKDLNNQVPVVLSVSTHSVSAQNLVEDKLQ
jgi:hypothetical protein